MISLRILDRQVKGMCGNTSFRRPLSSHGTPRRVGQVPSAGLQMQNGDYRCGQSMHLGGSFSGENSFLFFFFSISWAAPVAFGGSQARV